MSIMHEYLNGTGNMTYEERVAIWDRERASFYKDCFSALLHSWRGKEEARAAFEEVVFACDLLDRKPGDENAWRLEQSIIKALPYLREEEVRKNEKTLDKTKNAC